MADEINVKNTEFILIDENNRLITSSLSYEDLVYSFIISLNHLPEMTSYVHEDSEKYQTIKINNFQTGFNDKEVSCLINGYLILDNNTYTIVQFNIDLLNE